MRFLNENFHHKILGNAVWCATQNCPQLVLLHRRSIIVRYIRFCVSFIKFYNLFTRVHPRSGRHCVWGRFVCCLSVCTACSGRLHNGRRLAAVVCVQFALRSRYSSAHPAGRQSGVQRRPAVPQHRPEGHLLRHRMQVRPCSRPRPDAR